MPLVPEVEPSVQDLDNVVSDLTRSWTATVTVRRQSEEGVGYREIFVLLDDEPIGVLRHGDVLARDVQPGPHRLRVHNTLFKKTIEFTLAGGEHARFTATNRAGWGTYSVWAFWIGFLGAGPFYLTLERE